MMAKRLQRRRRAGHCGTALRIVEVAFRAGPVKHSDPQPAGVSGDFPYERARQGGA